jgi:geranylgeranyl pyrophosphate synthase
MLAMEKDKLLDALKPYLDEANAIAVKKAAEAKSSLKILPESVAKGRLETLCEYVVTRNK